MVPMTDKVGVDSNLLTYLIEAYNSGFDPFSDPFPVLVPERVAALRLFLYLDVIYLLPTVCKETEGIRDRAKLKQHMEFSDILLHEISDKDLNTADVEKRVKYYYTFHPNQKDCRIVAEAELAGLDIFLTFDRKLINKLNGRTQSLRIMESSQYWNKLDIPKGTPSKWLPHPTNPLYKTDWWRWQ